MRSPNLFREGIFANAGCLTRGSLPVPKRSNLADSEDEVDEDEDIPAWSPTASPPRRAGGIAIDCEEVMPVPAPVPSSFLFAFQLAQPFLIASFASLAAA